jgi:flagellar basal body rod protein FlgG
MSRGFYSAVSAMNAAERQLDVVADNMANAGSRAFKRRAIGTSQFKTLLAGRPAVGTNVQTGYDFQQGLLTNTGEPLDLALFGEGFFAIDGPDGEVYTRDGQLHLDPSGEIVTSGGAPVAWASKRGQVDPAGARLSVDPAGAVRQGNEEIGRLRIVEFEDPTVLRPQPNGMWRAPADVRPLDGSAEVRQGALEGSNVNVLAEMIEMISLQRSYESAANVMRQLDEIHRRLVRG